MSIPCLCQLISVNPQSTIHISIWVWGCRGQSKPALTVSSDIRLAKHAHGKKKYQAFFKTPPAPGIHRLQDAPYGMYDLNNFWRVLRHLTASHESSPSARWEGTQHHGHVVVSEERQHSESPGSRQFWARVEKSVLTSLCSVCFTITTVTLTSGFPIYLVYFMHIFQIFSFIFSLFKLFYLV